jgi:hypothetical protein
VGSGQACKLVWEGGNQGAYASSLNMNRHGG